MAASTRWTGKVAAPGSRAAAETRLIELRETLRAALADKKTRMLEFVESCKADRRAIREQVRAMRARSTRDLRDQVQAARGAAKLTRLTRLAEVRQTTNAAVDRARALAAVERQHQEELARIARSERSRQVEIRLAHERALAATDLRSVLFGKLAAVFEREARSLRPAAGESRAEALLRFAERNAEKAHKAVEPHVHRKAEQAKRAVDDAERTVRAVGGNVRARRTTSPQPRDRSARPIPTTTAPTPEAAPTPTMPVATQPPTAPPAAPKKAPSRPRAKAPKVRAAKPAKAPAAPKGAKPAKAPAKPARPETTPKRRLGQIPQGGMLLKDFLAENAAVAAKKAARGKRKPGAKPAAVPTASAPLPPAVPAANSNSASGGAGPSGQQALFTSAVAESTRPYKVRASCGHIVVRPMREATAGVPYSPDVVIEAPKGRACDACEAKKNYGANAPKPSPKKDVKAPELKDTAEIAARVRADIADAVRTKKLPKGRYSVRTSKYSQGSEINIVASGLPFPMLNPDAFELEKGSRHMAFARDRFATRYTPEAEQVLKGLAAIVDAYHWDRSDPSTDYYHARFGRDVRLDDEEEWKRINAEKVAASSGVQASGSPS